jgi:leader peptidase (prepilin peptidase) / N-methyltransferase
VTLPALVACCGLVGLAVASFVNVVAYRVPRHESIVTPGSHCPACDHAVRPFDNVPLVSWLLLGGRCRDCGERISVRYPLVEALGGLVFALTALALGASWALPAFLVLMGGLLALACVDLEQHLLPVRILYPVLAGVALLLVGAAAGSGAWQRLLVAGACAAGWFAAFFVLNALSPRLLGFGDVRLAALIGLGLGWLGVPFLLLGIFAGCFAGSVVGLGLIGAGRMRRDTPLPFGVFLALGALIAVVLGPALFDRIRLS